MASFTNKKIENKKALYVACKAIDHKSPNFTRIKPKYKPANICGAINKGENNNMLFVIS
jgi:hypothetical protein